MVRDYLRGWKYQTTLSYNNTPSLAATVTEHKKLISLISNLYILQYPQFYAVSSKDIFEYRFVSVQSVYMSLTRTLGHSADGSKAYLRVELFALPDQTFNLYVQR